MFVVWEIRDRFYEFLIFRVISRRIRIEAGIFVSRGLGVFRRFYEGV